MAEQDLKKLTDAFVQYRNLLTPVTESLTAFMGTYGEMRENIEKLNSAFSGDVKQNIESIYKSLTEQANRAGDLAARVQRFSETAGKYTAEVDKLLTLMSRIESKLSAVNDLEQKAEQQIGKLDGILIEKTKNYNIRELERTLAGYNQNVEKVAEFVNKDVAETLSDSRSKLEAIKKGVESIANAEKSDSGTLAEVLEKQRETAALLKKITESGDVNETYIFEILDKWAAARRVKMKG